MGKVVTPTYALYMEGSTPSAWRKSDGRPTEKNLEKYIMDFVKSQRPGGVNAHIPKAFGRVIHPSWAYIKRQSTGAKVAEWKAASFQVYGSIPKGTVGTNPAKSFQDVARGHQIKIAKQTLRYPDAIAGVMGGPDKATAREILKESGQYKGEIKAYDEKYNLKKNPPFTPYPTESVEFLGQDPQGRRYHLRKQDVWVHDPKTRTWSWFSTKAAWPLGKRVRKVKKNPPYKWHRKQEDKYLKQYKGAMTKPGQKFYEGKVAAEQDAIRWHWAHGTRRPKRKK